MDQLAAMRAFTRVVETGSFTRSADLLRMPKATLTKHVQTLEAHLQTRLLNRTTRRVTVTPDGAAYYERALAILHDIDELDGSLSSAQAVPRGKLRIDISPSLATRLLMPALPDFVDRYPDITLDVGCTDRPVDLLSENVDCVIRVGEIQDPNLVARRIGVLRFITVASPGYIARYGAPQHPLDFEETHKLIRYFSAQSGRYHPFDFTRGDEVVELSGRYSVATNDGNAYIAAALAGLGAIMSPVFQVEEHLASGTLVPILTEWEAGEMPIHVVYPPSRHLTSRLRVFVDWVAELFARSEVTRRRAA
ncbi:MULTISPECIES: LysR family transcriptional regulator [Xanthobacter]|uniref:LysR family transcriptional regulator n=1 Tax=Xanthobacter TaxID=279 RepID=UPI00145CB3BB|nr:LysR family transcriptional regulator [Xanthobacter sp. SG618]NMN57896.1 DNA-binding transcriptional LysR family regulator [Xanthobacter sp. SG618]